MSPICASPKLLQQTLIARLVNKLHNLNCRYVCVPNLDVPIVVEQQIGCMNIAMNDSRIAAVQPIEAACHIKQQFDTLMQRHCRSSVRSVDQIVDRAVLDKLAYQSNTSRKYTKPLRET